MFIEHRLTYKDKNEMRNTLRFLKKNHIDLVAHHSKTNFTSLKDKVFFLTALLTITRIMNQISNREEMKYMCKVIRSDEVKRAGANGTRGPMRGTAHLELFSPLPAQ